MPPRHFMQDDKKRKRTLPSKLLWKWMFGYLKQFKSKFWIFTILLLVFTAFQAVLPLLQGTLIDEGLRKGDWHTSIIIIIIYGVLRIGSSVGNAIVEFKMAKIGTNVVYDIRNDLFESLQETSMDYFDKSHSGDIISIATNDVDQLNQVFGGMIAIMFSDLFRMVLVIGIMLYWNLEMAILSFLMMPIFFFISRGFMKYAKSGFRKIRKKISHVTSIAEQNISGMKVIQAYGKQDQAAAEFDRANKANQETLLKVRRIFAFFMPLIFLLSGIWGALLMMYGGTAVIRGVSLFGSQITVGIVSSFNDYLFQLLMPMFMIAQFSQIAESMLAASERIYLLLHEEKAIPDPETPRTLSSVTGKVEINNVTFSYSARETQEELNAIFDVNQKSPLPQKLKRSNLNKETKSMISQKAKAFDNEKPEKSPFSHLYSNHELLLKIARGIDREVKGEDHQLQMASGGNGGGGGMQGGEIAGSGSKSKKKAPQSMNPMMFSRNQKLKLLGSPKIPKELYEQFSPTVRTMIEEDRRIREHKKSTGIILDRISLKIEPGQTVAIVGPTGAGKTTIIKLIARFYDIANGNGEILLDGVNIKDITKKELRNIIGMVPQDSFLFSGTILENLYYGVEENSQNVKVTEKLTKITKFLGLHNFIMNMPDGYQTILKENAANISVGQRQLIAFARVLMNDPQILILDEATSAVDPYTESLIQEALEKAKVGRTTIIIAHRLSTIKNADKIFVVDHGHIVESGNHQELINKNGHYATLVEMQAQDIT